MKGVLNIREIGGMNTIVQQKLNAEQLNPVYEEMARLIGLDMVMKIYLQYRGQQISFPSKLYSKAYTEEQMLKEFKAGSTYRELSIKYSYSERWVREIIKKYQLKENN